MLQHSFGKLQVMFNQNGNIQKWWLSNYTEFCATTTILETNLVTGQISEIMEIYRTI